MFIDHRQGQWPEWLGTAEFVYNNKAYSSTRMSLFKANYRQNLRMGFERRKKGKYERAKRFVTKMKEIQEKVKAVLGKAQEGMKRAEVNDYKVED